LALEAFFVFGAISNYYRYFFLKIYIDIYLAVFSTALAAILLIFIVILLISFLDKRKFLKSFQKISLLAIFWFHMHCNNCVGKTVLWFLFQSSMQRGALL